MTKLLIVENDKEELDRALDMAHGRGYNPVAATSLAEADAQLRAQPSHVLTDLFFPLKYADNSVYVDEVLPVYDEYAQRRYGGEWKNNPMRLAIQQCADLFGVTVDEYVSDIIPKDNPKIVVDAVKRVAEENKKYERFMKLIEEIKTGENFPSGIYVARTAKQYGIPCVIVTSTHHHDDAFEAVRGEVGVRYVDRLVDGRKDWARGIELLAL